MAPPSPTVTGITAAQAVDTVLTVMHGLRGYLTGSAAAAADKDHAGIGGFQFAYHDVDVFFGTEQEWVRSIQFLLDRGFQFGDRGEMLWNRILHYGTHGWHTNSMKLLSPGGIELNLIFKKVGGNTTTSLSAVLESFDFGLLSLGWETETGIFRDARSYQFDDLDPHGPLPLLPWRRESIRQGHFREHQGMRTFGRAARYFHEYGYDGSMVLPDLIEGYQNAATYMLDRIEPEKKQLGNIYQSVATYLEFQEWDLLIKASEALPSSNDLDVIYEILVEV